jgi:hypothetical protein
MAVELTCDELSTLEVLVDMERADRLRWCIANGEQEKNDEIYRFYDVLYYKLLDVRQEIKLGD